MNSLPPTSGLPQTDGFDSIRPDDEMLVAYLDGELDAQSISAVELKLASDTRLRGRLNDLRTAWDLLEELPPAEPSPRFAQSTIEMLAMSPSAVSDDPAVRKRRRQLWISTLALIPVLFVAGYGIARQAQRRAEKQAVAELHVLADWDVFHKVGSYDWLKQIRTVENLDRVAKRTSSGLGNGKVPEGIEERKAWIQQLSNTDRDRLSANLDDFQLADFRKRQSIIELADKIYKGSDPEGDLQAARDYASFVNELSIDDRTVHFDQTDRLADLTQRVNRKMPEVYTQELSPDAPDRVAVRQWIKDMEAKYGDLLPSSRSGPSVFLALNGRDRGNSAIGDEDLDSLLQSLAPEAQKIIGRLRTVEAQHSALILYFINDAYPSFSRFGSRRYIGRAQLSERFDAMPDSEKTALEFLPPDRAQSRLGLQSTNGRNRAGFAPPSSSRNNLIREDREKSEKQNEQKEPK